MSIFKVKDHWNFKEMGVGVVIETIYFQLNYFYIENKTIYIQSNNYQTNILLFRCICVNWRFVLFYFKDKTRDFTKQQKNIMDTLGTLYDYGSIMHYGATIFSKNGKPTLVPKFNTHGTMGQRSGFSEMDIWKIKKLYGCVNGNTKLNIDVRNISKCSQYNTILQLLHVLFTIRLLHIGDPPMPKWKQLEETSTSTMDQSTVFQHLTSDHATYSHSISTSSATEGTLLPTELLASRMTISTTHKPCPEETKRESI